MGSLTTCDPGDIEATIKQCVAQNVRCSVISLAAEVRMEEWIIWFMPSREIDDVDKSIFSHSCLCCYV